MPNVNSTESRASKNSNTFHHPQPNTQHTIIHHQTHSDIELQPTRLAQHDPHSPKPSTNIPPTISPQDTHQHNPISHTQPLPHDTPNDLQITAKYKEAPKSHKLPHTLHTPKTPIDPQNHHQMPGSSKITQTTTYSTHSKTISNQIQETTYLNDTTLNALQVISKTKPTCKRQPTLTNAHTPSIISTYLPQENHIHYHILQST
ncbi:hypothetical protein KC19_7G056000 [Ceratodon purpureus]|uniref:Uncharacterized protein n=1 Tax=Ceratodon purpureus TaxID=3225 RepID=A0A8T0H7Z0_CERPU|nr:hypothetical protein KC19_7G056000 [Ceratodon purpureus]